MPKVAITLHAIDESPEKRTWQPCSVHGPFEDDQQVADFLNKVDPGARGTRKILVVEGELFSRRSDGQLVPTPPILTAIKQ